MAAYGLTYGGSVFAGAISAFLASRFPMLSWIFDDEFTHEGVYYGLYMEYYNNDQRKPEHIEVLNTDRSEGHSLTHSEKQEENNFN